MFFMVKKNNIVSYQHLIIVRQDIGFKIHKFIVFISVLLIIMVGHLSGCSSKVNYAPVRPHQRDLISSHKIYQVKRGDTLYSIGFRSGHGYQRLAKWNNLSSPYKLQIGQKINLFKLKQNLNRVTKKTKKNKTVARKKMTTRKTLTISNNNKKVLKLTWQWPIEGKILKNFSQTGNKGIDINGKIGQKVKSAATGKVVYTGSGLAGYGNLLIVKHNYLYLSAYANNSRLLVKEGQAVNKGQVIAEVGRVGSRQASLHFEIRKNGKPVNPKQYLPK